MTYCGAEISYGRGNCAFPFVMSSWHHMEEKKKKHTSLLRHIFFFFLSCYFIFQLLRKTNKSSQILPIYSLPVRRPGASSFFFFFPKFIRVCKWRCVSFNRRVSHVTRAEGSKGTQGGGRGRRLQCHRRGGGGGEISTCPHLLWERVALCIMETHRWIFFFLSSHELKHGNTTLTHLPAS